MRGNLAYRVEQAPPPKPAKTTKYKKRAGKKKRKSLKPIFSVIAVSIMAAVSVYRGVELMEMNSLVAAKKMELEAVMANIAQTKIDLERSVDLSVVEQRAIANGMKKPGQYQIYYMTLQNDTFGESVDDLPPQPSIFDPLINGVREILEYFQ